MQIQNGPVEPLPLATTVRAETRRSTAAGLGLAGDLENVITLEPVGNQMVHGLLALEGGDAGAASHELPNNGALTTARGDRSDCHERHAESGEEPVVDRFVLHRESCLGVMQRIPA